MVTPCSVSVTGLATVCGGGRAAELGGGGGAGWEAQAIKSRNAGRILKVRMSKIPLRLCNLQLFTRFSESASGTTLFNGS
jgi:hypothetical protein